MTRTQAAPLTPDQRAQAFNRAMDYVTSTLPRAMAAALPSGSGPSGTAPAPAAFSAGPSSPAPLLYGPSGTPIRPDSSYTVRRTAAKRVGSLQNWVPQRLISRQAEARDREEIALRAADLVGNDPHAAGLVNGRAVTVIGFGLSPHPVLDPEELGLTKEQVRAIQKQQLRAYRRWEPYADASERDSFGEIQFAAKRSLVQNGEYLILIHMIDDPWRPYGLACRLVNPLRLKTPTDRTNANIYDGIELGEHAAPVAYWIKKSSGTAGISSLPDTSANFIRVPVRTGHRWNVLHGFITKDPEQLRGISDFTPAMKLFRDFSDLLDAELVSNIVTAALSYYIEVSQGQDPYNMAALLSGVNQIDPVTGQPAAQGPQASPTPRFQNVAPGQIWFGDAGTKPHLLSASRPGVTFEPFLKILKKALALCVDTPYPVAFKDVEGVTFAGYRSAMLEAWRVFVYERIWMGRKLCQVLYTMLQEEAYLRGELDVPDFYTNMAALTRCEWRGYPKGDIEPIKAAQADIMRIDARLKSRTVAVAEDGGEFPVVADQLEEEEEILRKRNLTPAPAASPAPAGSLSAPGEETDTNDKAALIAALEARLFDIGAQIDELKESL